MWKNEANRSTTSVRTQTYSWKDCVHTVAQDIKSWKILQERQFASWEIKLTLISMKETRIKYWNYRRKWNTLTKHSTSCELSFKRVERLEVQRDVEYLLSCMKYVWLPTLKNMKKQRLSQARTFQKKSKNWRSYGL